MRYLVFLAMLVAFPVQADLYRWVDPQSGSVKFSSYPPPWFGDPQRERGAPAVEVIPYRGPGAPAKPVAAPEKPSPAASTRATLEARWAGLMQFFATLPATTDFNRAGSGIQQQLEAYQALSAELDRLDPAGAQRRRAQEAGVFETMRRGLEAQLSAKPPPQ
jgi:hypothetical protein